MPRAWLTCVAVCALAVLTAGLATPSLAQAEDDTVTTTLEPGPNLAGWTQSAADIEVIFDAIPELEVVYAWDGQHQRFLWAVRTDAGLLGDLKELNPGMGLWLLLGGEEPFSWTRPLVERAGALSLQEGWNLVAWAAGGGASPSDALQGLSDILTAAADATGAEPSSLSRGGAFWLKTSAPAVWEQPTTLASPERMEAIQDLPWVKDGLTDFEEASVDDLRYLAEARPRSFRALMQKSWIEGQHDLAMQNVLLYLAHMARQSREAPVYDILQMTLLDSVTRSNHALRTAMSEIVFGRQEGWEQSLRKIAAASRREEDITGWNISLQYIRERDPEVSEIVEKIPWIAEILRGSSVREYNLNDHSAILRTVTRMYIRYPLLLDKLLSWEWFSETPSRSTYSIVESLDNLARYVGKDFALLVAGMPFLDTIDGYEWEAMEFLQGLARSDKQEVVETVARASSVDGIDDEGALLLRLAYLQANDVLLGGVLGNMAWLGDGVADSERRAAVLVQHLAFEAEPLLHSLAARGWLDDGVSRAEEGVLDQFLSLAGRVARKDIAVAVRISGMPFLDSVDGADAAAMRSLVGIHWEGSESPLMDILDHPTLEGGLADEATPLVAVLHDVGRGGGADFNKDVALAVLEPGAFKVETRVVPVPGLEEVRLAVVAREGTAPRTLDLLEEAVLDQINFMRTPFPGSFAGLAVVDRSGAGGGGPGGIITIAPGYENSRHLIAHEVAHTYWPFYPPWLAEGPAEFMANRFAGPQLLGACSIADTLGELDRLAQENSDVYYAGACAYTLGSSLFVDLYRAVGDEAFRQGFSRLYLALRSETHTAVCSGAEKGVCYVKQAFVTNAPPEAAALAEPVINRAYYGDPDEPADDP